MADGVPEGIEAHDHGAARQSDDRGTVRPSGPSGGRTARGGNPPHGRNEFPLSLLGPAILCFVCWFVYSTSLFGRFVFDDIANITDNKAVHQLWPPGPMLSFAPRRFVVYVTFAFNYVLGGNDVRGYHLFNIAVHTIASLALFGLLRRTFRLPQFHAAIGPRAEELALVTTLIWMVHPLQTQSVTYIVQRTESLMGMFFILLFYCAVRGDSSPRPGIWYALGVGCCFLGTFTKEVMLTAPPLLLLYDRIVLAPSWREVLEKRGALYLGCFACWVPFFTFMRDAFVPGIDAQGFGSKLIRWDEYARSQPEVIVHYLKIIYWPRDLCLDYCWPIVKEPHRMLLPAVPLAVVLLISFALMLRRSAIGLAIFAFYWILAPTSSIVPIIDLAFEHRLYLPLLLPVLLTVLAVDRFIQFTGNALGRPKFWTRVLPAVLATTVVLALCYRTVRRNMDYQNDILIWADVIRQRPDNGRGYHNLAVAEESTLGSAPDDTNRARWNETIDHYRTAIRLSTEQKGQAPAKFYINAANLLGRARRHPEALAVFRDCIKYHPGYAEAYFGEGLQLQALEKHSEAIASFETAIRLHSDFYHEDYHAVREFRGASQLAIGGWREAAKDFASAADRNPQRPELRLRQARAEIAGRNTLVGLTTYERVRRERSPPQSATFAVEGATAAAEAAWVLATDLDPNIRDGRRAEALAREAEAAFPQRWDGPEALAAALAEREKFAEAIAVLEAAQVRIGTELPGDVRQRWTRHLALYEEGRPVRVVSAVPGNPLGR